MARSRRKDVYRAANYTDVSRLDPDFYPGFDFSLMLVEDTMRFDLLRSRSAEITTAWMIELQRLCNQQLASQTDPRERIDCFVTSVI